MTKDLRQAILALTDAVKTVEGHALEGLRQNVLDLMPPGPILETLWAALPVPLGMMVSAPAKDRWEVQAFYEQEADANRIHTILSRPFDALELELRHWTEKEEREATAARLSREHALEVRLLAERGAFREDAPDNPLRMLMRGELNGALYCEYPTGLDISKHVDDSMARLMAASTAPIHVEQAEVVDGVEEG